MKNEWHRADTKCHICIWSDRWMENYERSFIEKLEVDGKEYFQTEQSDIDKLTKQNFD